MYKILEEHSKSIDDLYQYIEIIESCLKKIEKRISDLEKSSDSNGYYE